MDLLSFLFNFLGSLLHLKVIVCQVAHYFPPCSIIIYHGTNKLVYPDTSTSLFVFVHDIKFGVKISFNDEILNKCGQCGNW